MYETDGLPLPERRRALIAIGIALTAGAAFSGFGRAIGFLRLSQPHLI